MKIAFIPPFSHLNTTFRTNYQLMLPQLTYREDYSEVYKYHCDNPNQFVILDNGAAEGIDWEWKSLLEIAYEFDVDEIVLPDTLRDKDNTIQKAEQFKHHVEETPDAELNDFKWMFVAQGTTVDEFVESGIWAAGQDWITTIGIPRHALTSVEDPSRMSHRSHISNRLTAAGSDKEIHFLGANKDYPNEVETLANRGSTIQAYVRGMDTSMPFNYAFRGIECHQAGIGRPDNYFDRGLWEFNQDILEKNLQKFEKHMDVM